MQSHASLSIFSSFLSLRMILMKLLIILSRYSEDLELEDAIHTAILTLKEGFEGQMTADNIEIGICNEKGFKRLTPSEVKDFLENVH